MVLRPAAAEELGAAEELEAAEELGTGTRV
jgi:hypothetical protein